MALDIVGVDYLIDEELSEEKILERLQFVEDEILLNDREIVIVIRPYKKSIRVLKAWLDERLSEGFQIAPISYFVTDN